MPPASPAFPVQHLLDVLHAKYRGCNDGSVATYIPELAKVDGGQFGIAVATGDGHVYETGDARAPFTVQSVSKAIVYGIALQDRGRAAVLERIGVEPSGEAFNSISFEPKYNRPFNPMVNAGAIAATALVTGASGAERFARIHGVFEAFAGRPLAIDEAVYRSESVTGHRNRAIAYMALNHGMIDGDVEGHLDVYFRQCSILVTARDLAVMGATLAGGGVNPLTGRRAMAQESVRDVLSVMSTCGMYDYAGEWQFNVGLPAKSGVGGGIMAVLPGHLGIGVFSPRLDESGNSRRGVLVCEDLSSSLKLHLLDFRGPAHSAIRRVYRGSEVRSRCLRRPAEVAHLDGIGFEIVVYELQGDLSFANVERLTREVIGCLAQTTFVILDARRLSSMDLVAGRLIRRLADAIVAEGPEVALVPPATADVPAAIAEVLDCTRMFGDVDAALEHCEDRLLDRAGLRSHGCTTRFTLADIDVFHDLDAAEQALLGDYVTYERFARGTFMVREGDDSDRLFAVLHGRAEIQVRLADATEPHRLGTLNAGSVFGEPAMFAAGRRTADVVALTDLDCCVLTTSALERLHNEHSRLHARLLGLVGRSLTDRLRRANAEIRALAR